MAHALAFQCTIDGCGAAFARLDHFVAHLARGHGLTWLDPTPPPEPHDWRGKLNARARRYRAKQTRTPAGRAAWREAENRRLAALRRRQRALKPKEEDA